MATRKSSGRVIRISPDLYAKLEAAKRREFRSWDALLRCLVGLPPRRGKLRQLREGWVLPHGTRLFEKLSQARGAAVSESAATESEIEQPIKMREVL